MYSETLSVISKSFVVVDFVFRYKDNIKMIISGLGCESVNWFELVQYNVQL